MEGGQGGDISAHKTIFQFLTKLKTVKKRLINCPQVPINEVNSRVVYIFDKIFILFYQLLYILLWVMSSFQDLSGF